MMKDDTMLWQMVQILKQQRQEAGIIEEPFDIDRARALAKKGLNAISKQSRHYLIIIEPNNEDGYTAWCPAVDNCVVKAQTRKKVREAIRHELEQRLMEFVKKGQPLPTERGSVETVEIEIVPFDGLNYE